jgi:manganese transport protein
MVSLRTTTRTALRPIPVRQALTFLGPAFVVAVAYVDPGNLATNATAGARYGFQLLWVIVVANVIAMLVQYLSAKLGIATGRSLAEHCRDAFSRPVTLFLWVQAEIVVMMTDLAEVVGGAVALQLLFGIPLLSGALITVAGMSVILVAQQRGRRQFEAVIVALLSVVLVAFVYQTVRAGVSSADAAAGLVPSFAGRDSVVLAVGIVGATVMPHAVYLHSALTQGLGPTASSGRRRFAVRSTLSDVLIALTVAGGINIAILLGATSLRGTVAQTLGQVHDGLARTSGSTASLTFAIALLASGLAASSVGVYSGQVVMQGFLRRRVPIWIRRAVSIIPAVGVLAVGVEPTSALVASQVALSFVLPFALFPLLRFTADRRLMGELVDGRATRVCARAATLFVVAMNGYLVFSQVLG